MLGEGIDFVMPTSSGRLLPTTTPCDPDIANLKDAVDGTGVKDAFMTAASPGVISSF